MMQLQKDNTSQPPRNQPYLTSLPLNPDLHYAVTSHCREKLSGSGCEDGISAA